MSVRIIIDSASDITKPLCDKMTILPMLVAFGDKEYSDGVNLTHKQFYEMLIESDTLPVTAQITPEQYRNVFETAVNNGETVVAITISSKLSGTYQSACLAAMDYPDKVFVVDSENATIGFGILVKRAVELLNEGHTAQEIAVCLDIEKKDIRLIALLDTLEYLKRGGRLSKSAAMVGGLLSIKPVVCVEDGEVKVIGKARGSKNGNNLLMQEIEKTNGIDFERPFLLGYTGLTDALLNKYISDSAQLWEGKTDTLPVSTIGGAIGTHVGPGAVAVAFFKK